MCTDNISFAMCSLSPVGGATMSETGWLSNRKFTSVTLSTNISLTSIHVQLYPVTGKIYKKSICTRLLGFFKIV